MTKGGGLTSSIFRISNLYFLIRSLIQCLDHYSFIIEMRITVLLGLLAILSQAEVYQVNLDLPPTKRFTQMAAAKKDSIVAFIDYLKSSSQKFGSAFKAVAKLYQDSPDQLSANVGEQYFEECLSVASGCGLPVSDIIVFNYMYELGVASDFCTSITLSTKEHKLLARNLDYGFQKYLVNNSVQIQYVKGGQIQYEILGHAGFVGTHTAMKRGTQLNHYRYAISFNQRMIGIIHQNIEHMITSKCQTISYSMIKLLRSNSKKIKDIVDYLSTANTCVTAYYTIIDHEGHSFQIEKNRGHSSNLIRGPTHYNDAQYIVQTNHDYSVPDPDTRSTIATNKLRAAIQAHHDVNTSDVWKILIESPNFNSLTLTSSVLDPKNGVIVHKVWPQS